MKSCHDAHQHRQMPSTTKRLLNKLREMEARRGVERPPSRGLLSPFARGLAEFLQDYRRITSFYAGSFSIVIYCAFASYVGAIVALLFQWPAIYPAAAACLATIILRHWVRNAKKRHD
jgi:hypothetical protein